MAFNSGDFFKDAFGAISESGSTAASSAAAQAGGTVRAVGQQPVFIVNNAVKTVKDLPDLPLANNLSINGAVDIFKEPSKSNLNGILADITGINIAQAFSPTNATLIGQRIASSLVTLSKQIVDEIKNCIDQKILSLTRKNPIAELFFLYNLKKSQLLAQITTTIDRAIAKAVNDLFFKKLQIQQLALYRQKILSEVRKLCPDASPTAVRNYTKDATASTKAATIGSRNITSGIQSSAVTSSTAVTKTWKDLV